MRFYALTTRLINCILVTMMREDLSVISSTKAFLEFLLASSRPLFISIIKSLCYIVYDQSSRPVSPVEGIIKLEHF